jgi:fructose-bisphosphate aldolase class II
VEAELGKIGGTEDDIHVSEKEAMYTDPEEARFFVEGRGRQSGHSYRTVMQYKGEPSLIMTVAENKSFGGIPIVLHGLREYLMKQCKRLLPWGSAK